LTHDFLLNFALSIFIVTNVGHIFLSALINIEKLANLNALMCV